MSCMAVKVGCHIPRCCHCAFCQMNLVRQFTVAASRSDRMQPALAVVAFVTSAFSAHYIAALGYLAIIVYSLFIVKPVLHRLKSAGGGSAVRQDDCPPRQLMHYLQLFYELHRWRTYGAVLVFALNCLSTATATAAPQAL